MKQPLLIVMSGLPGSGKSTVAEGLARHLSAPIFSVDPIEAAMWGSGLDPSDTGITAYRVAQALAAENLQQGFSVIVDAVNPVAAARNMWRDLAKDQDVPLFFLEVRCADKQVHKKRIEARRRNIPGMSEITWERVQERQAEFEPWAQGRLLLDSSIESAESLISLAVEHLKSRSS